MIDPTKIGAFDEQGMAVLQKFMEQVSQHLNGGLHPTQNFNAKEVKVVFMAADTETLVPHGLGRIPSEFVVISKDAGSSVYESTSKPRTSDRIYLKATAPVKATIRFM